MKKHIFIFIIFSLLTLVFTFPLIANFSKSCLGFSSSDEVLHPIWSYWYLKYALIHKISLMNTDFLAYPFGIKIFGDFCPYIYLGMVIFLSKFFNYIATYNIQILLSFILTGFFTYLLVYNLTKSIISGLISGIIFTFCPQHFMRSWQHLTLSYFQWMPLYLLALFELKNRPSFKRSVLLSLSIFLLASFELHYLFFMFIATILFAIIYFFNASLNDFVKFIRFLLLGGFVSLIFIMIQLYTYMQKMFFSNKGIAAAHNIFNRPFEDLFSQSAKLLSYFLPSTEHFIFGGFTSMFIGSPLYGNSLTENNLYLGIVALTLAFFGWKLHRKETGGGGNFSIKFFLGLAIVSWFLSQPPWWQIFNFKLPMPSFFIYKFLPMFRAYCRFGILLNLSIAVLAGFGIKYILLKFNSRFKKQLFYIIVCSLVIFDFWNNPCQHAINLTSYNMVYDWLREKKERVIIAEYPLDINGSNDFYKFFQTIHEKKMINGTIPGTQANDLTKKISKLSDSYTAGVLKWLGVKYVVVHREGYLQTGLIEESEELNNIHNNKGLELVTEFPRQPCPDDGSVCLAYRGPVDVYKVIASPIKP